MENGKRFYGLNSVLFSSDVNYIAQAKSKAAVVKTRETVQKHKFLEGIWDLFLL